MSLRQKICVVNPDGTIEKMKKKKEDFTVKTIVETPERLEGYTGILRVFANMLVDDVQKTHNMDIGRIQGIVGIMDETIDDLVESAKTVRILIICMTVAIFLLLCIIVF